MRPTAAVRLADGWWARDGSCEREVVVAALCGADEEWLGEVELQKPVPVVATDVLVRCLRLADGASLPRERVAALSLGDRERLVRAVWALTFGERVQVVLACPHAACGAPMDVDFRVTADPAPLHPRPAVHRAVLDGVQVSFRLPRGEDLEALAASPDDDARALLARCLIDPPASLSAGLLEAAEAEIAHLSDEHDDEMEAVCPQCERAFLTPFDPLAALLAQLARRRWELDRDVHLLSLHYHWPLDCILALPRPRRRAYVNVLLAHLEPSTTTGFG
jgi:hypothetical protein